MKKVKFITKVAVITSIAVAFIVGVKKGFKNGFLSGANLKGC